jgi:DNA-binding transcriptional LysR family regulator
MPGVAVMNAAHPLAAKSVIKADDLSQAPFIALNPEDSTRLRLETQLRGLGVVLKPLVETPYSHTVCELALAGVGVGFAHPLVALDFAQRGLVVRPFDVDVAFTGVLVFRPGTPMSENARVFLQHMRIQLEADRHALAALSGRKGRGSARGPGGGG